MKGGKTQGGRGHHGCAGTLFQSGVFLITCRHHTPTHLVVEDAHLARVRDVRLALFRLENGIGCMMVKDIIKKRDFILEPFCA